MGEMIRLFLPIRVNLFRCNAIQTTRIARQIRVSKSFLSLSESEILFLLLR